MTTTLRLSQKEGCSSPFPELNDVDRTSSLAQIFLNQVVAVLSENSITNPLIFRLLYKAVCSSPFCEFKRATGLHLLPVLKELIQLVLTEGVVLTPVKVVGAVAIKRSTQT